MANDVLDVRGMEEELVAISQRLEALNEDLRGPIMRTGVRRSIKPTLGRAQRLADASSDTGVYADSLGLRIFQIPRKGFTYGIIGARARFKRTQVDKSGTRRVRNPRNYAHLVEHGFTHRTAGRVKGPEPVKRAWQQTNGRQIPTLVGYVGPEMEKRVRRLARQKAKAGANG